MQVAIDPRDATQVAGALTGLLEERGFGDVRFAEAPAAIGRGFDTLIYAFRLDGDTLDAGWRRPLVLRIYPGTDQDAKARREAAVQEFAAGCGYPALTPLAVAGSDGPFGLPLMVMERVEGRTLLERITANPLGARRRLARMAELHAALHRLPIQGVPLPYDAPLVERQLNEVRQRIDRYDQRHLEAGYAWLAARRRTVIEEEPSLCHGDFHPLNVLEGLNGRLFVIDWPDASIGDRHFDVARTLALFWIAKIAASSRVERALLGAARGFLRSSYLNRYRAVWPVDDGRLRYWEAFQTFWGWLQLSELKFDTRISRPPDMVDRLPANLEEEVKRRFWHCADVTDRWA